MTFPLYPKYVQKKHKEEINILYKLMCSECECVFDVMQVSAMIYNTAGFKVLISEALAVSYPFCFSGVEGFTQFASWLRRN